MNKKNHVEKGMLPDNPSDKLNRKLNVFKNSLEVADKLLSLLEKISELF